MSDSETIARRRAQFAASFNREDIAALSDLITEDNVAMPPNRPALRGKDENRTFWREGFAAAESRLSIVPETLDVSGDIAVDRFRWSMDSAPRSGGEPIHDEGKNIWIWRRQPDGGWRLAQAIWNSDLPKSGLWSGAASSAASTLSAEDLESIRDIIERRWTAACLAGDWDNALAMCAEDSVHMNPDEPAVRGHAELRAWFEKFPRIVKFTQSTRHVEGLANLAVAQCTAALTVEASGTQLDSTGKLICCFRKQPSGEWLVTSVCWNLDRPMAAQ